MTIQALPYVILLGFLFGSTLIASRFSVGQYHPATYLGLRMMMASLGYCTFYLFHFQKRRWPRGGSLWGHAALLGVFGTAVPMFGIVGSLQYQSAGVTSILLTAGPALTVLLAHFFLTDEFLNRRKSLGVLMALGGAFLLAIWGESGLPDVAQASPIGYGMVFTGMLAGSSMTIYARKYLRHYDALDVASIRMYTAALTVMPLSLLLVGFDMHQVDGRGYAALVYAALAGTFAAFLVAFYIIKQFGATARAMAQYVIPIVAGVGGVLILGEQITLGMVSGMLLIASGIALINQG